MVRLDAASLTALCQTAPNKKRKSKRKLKSARKSDRAEGSADEMPKIDCGYTIEKLYVIKKGSLDLDEVDVKNSNDCQPDDPFMLNANELCLRADDSPKVYSYMCNYCTTVCSSESEIVAHMKEKHIDEAVKKDQRKNNKIDQELVNSAKVVVDGKVYYHCKLCGKNLHSPYTFMWHTRIHTGERPFVCDLCGKQFRVSQGLVRHLKETHEGIKNFPCDLCGRMFATKRNVEEHRRIHTNERPYVCDLCGKAFKQKASLFVHNRSHSTTFPFHCSYCNQGFRTRPPLLLHITRHTGEKPHTCTECGRCFRIKYELKRHMLIHSDEKPFVCSECGANFRQKRYLRNHTRINHNRETT